LRREVADWARCSYDPVAFLKPTLWRVLGDLVRGTVVIDFDDLEDMKLRHQAAHVAQDGDDDVAAGLLREADAWERLQAQSYAAAAAVLVCSDDDARIVGGRAVVHTNAYPAATLVARTPRGVVPAGTFTFNRYGDDASPTPARRGPTASAASRAATSRFVLSPSARLTASAQGCQSEWRQARRRWCRS
jgi:hypothetical protein